MTKKPETLMKSHKIMGQKSMMGEVAALLESVRCASVRVTNTVGQND